VSDEPEIDPDEPHVLPVEEHLDLHAFSPKDVRDVVASYLEAALEAGFEEVRLIHGRGIGVQRESVRALLAHHTNVLSFADAPPERGGWGATVVRLKRT
jgi:dsDNA-specific endonuclease/ATPase MutS2